MNKVNITIQSPMSQNDLIAAVAHLSGHVTTLLGKVGVFANNGTATIAVSNNDAAVATGAVTIVNSTIAANDTFTFGTVTLTAKASGATAGQFNIGGSGAVTAANLAKAFNTSASISSADWQASAGGAVVTIYCLSGTSVANQVPLSVNVASGGMTLGASAMAGGVTETTKVQVRK